MKLSIIVPCYNVEKYLEKCIKSIISNNVKEEYEIILVNDGSTDNTEKIIDKLKKQYKQIRSISQKNKGLSGARNTGIEKAKGEYITFVDSDDYLDSNVYNKVLDKFKEYNYDMVMFGVEMIYDNESLNKKVNLGVNGDLKSKEEVKDIMTSIYPTAWNKVYRRDVLGNFRFKEKIKYEDVEFLYRILPSINSIGLVEDAFYNYIQRENSITYTFNKSLYDFIDNMNGLVTYYKKHNLYDEYKDELEYSYVRYIYATFIRRLSKCKDKKEFNRGVEIAIKNVNTNFPDYKNNKYMTGKKGFYLKHFNKLFASVIYLIDRNKLN